ncbi:MAG: thioredoxin domain-containing protein [Myxococcales bacterium]|nr:thioredoxin domain-containing protein [Myxococcales bacterium]
MTRAAVVALCAALLATSAHADKLVFDPGTIYKVPLGSAPADGPADAPITIVYWSDHACGYCYRVQATLDTLNRMFPGQIRWVHRTLPLDDDETLGAEAALAAAAQGQFRPMNDRLYALAGRVDRAAVELIARELGLDMVRFRADLDTRAHRAAIVADAAAARALGVSGTPAFFVNGRSIHGAQNLKTFVDVVDQELARAQITPGGYDALVAAGKLQADTPPEAERPEFELDTTAAYRVGLGLPGHQLGPDTAPVTVVVWSDFQCPYCKRSAPVVEKLREKYGDDVRVVFRHLAMQSHRHAQLAAEAAIAAADQGKFWAFHDQIWANFGQLTRPELDGFARAIGLDMAKFTAALDERRYRDLVVQESATALALGVDGTPTMFVNGQPVVGSRDFAAMDTIVGAHLVRAKQAISAGVPPGDIYALLMTDARGAERADPSRIPDISSMKVQLRSDDLARAVMAACRRRDRPRAAALASGLTGAARQRASQVCAGVGIDL